MQTTVVDFSPLIAATLTTCKQVLTDHYGARLYALILFGSAARQTLTPESDLDLLVVLQPPLDPIQELSTVVDIIYPLQLEASHWISAKPADQTEFLAGATQLYRNIHNEGIWLLGSYTQASLTMGCMNSDRDTAT